MFSRIEACLFQDSSEETREKKHLLLFQENENENSLS